MSRGNGLPLPLPSLRLLVAPLQLASAAIWQTVQQRVVMDYGMLEEFVTMVTEIVPELLGHRQRAQLTLSLRARLILELCHSESTADLQNIQPHLDKMQTLTSLWGTETDDTEMELELPDSNFQGLVQTLLKDPNQREHFFQEVFPVDIGPKYDTAIQALMRTFLSSLEKFLPLPDLQQVASLLSDVPSVLEECVESVSHSQQLMTLLQYHRDLGQLDNNDTQPSTDGDCILPASSLPPVERVVIANEQTHPETFSLAKDNYMDLFSKDFEVEVATVTEHKEMEIGTSMDVKEEEEEREESSIEEDCEKNNKQSSESNDEEAEDGADFADTVEHVAAMEPMDGNTLVSDSYVFDFHAGNKEVACEVETEDIGKEVEPYETVMIIGEDGVVEPFDGVMTSEEDDFIEKSKSCVKIKTIFKRGIPQTLKPTVHLQKLNINNLPMPLSNKQLRQNRGLKMKKFLSRERKAEVIEFSEGKSQANRTCPICGKTFNHNSDMRRHERGHTGERPHQCLKCRQHFRHRFTLRRHQLYVCGVDASQPSGESNKKPKVPNKCTVCDRVLSRSTDIKRHMLTRKCQRAKNKLSNMRAQEKSCQNASQQRSEVPSEGSTSSPATGQNEPETSSCMLQQPLPEKNYMETSSKVQHNSLPLESDRKESEVKNTKADSNLETTPVDSNSIAFHDPSQPRATAAKTRYVRRRWMCRICGNYYKGDKKSHMRSHTNERPFTCPQCGLTFKYNNNLRAHLRKLCKVRHLDSKDIEDICRKRFKCDECEVTFRLKSMLKAHQLTHNPLYCKVCRSVLPDISALASHKLRHQPVQCTMCEENFNMIRHLTKHYLDVHNFSGPFVCTQCKMSYTDLGGLLRHETTHSEDSPFQCSKCPKRFKWYQFLKQHEKIHNEEKRRYLCWECGKDVSSNALLKKHMERHHHYPNPKPKDKLYFCSQCGKSFETKSSCAAHENARHSAVRYPCKDCGKQFVNSSTLTRHALIHTGERPFQCTHPACDKTFRSASELKVHMRYHTGERPFKCEVCGKGFTQAYYLTIHKRRHTGERPHPCLHCDMRFDCAHSLNRHMNTHTKGGSYKCLDCGKGFARKYLLTAHQQKKHLDD